MKALLIIVLGLFLGGCYGTQAAFLDAEDVQESIQLRDAKDPKVCGKYTAMGDLNGVGMAGFTGTITGYVATGKNIDYQKCVESLKGQ